uniref:Endonuclease/exonuclease/phosphatase domain-containing protein n=1 Tax=Fagus sylvatica TaxID=28930 RepID=A0A2N9IJ19_FAGSY
MSLNSLLEFLFVRFCSSSVISCQRPSWRVSDTKNLNVEVARTFKPLWGRIVSRSDMDIEEDEAIEEVAFCETAFWVQLHGLPVRKMTSEVVTAICSSLGKIDHVSEGDANAEGGCWATPPGAMNCLAWNCRGLGNPRTVQELARLVRAQDPNVVFLIETWQDDGPLERLRCQLLFENKFVAKSKNKAPETQNREESWTLLRRLNSQYTLPWCCLGDFNELVRIDEKQGKHSRSDRQMQLFRDVLDDCGFVDLGFTGPLFTWTNNRAGDMTWERLDRVVATLDWLTQFPTARVHHLDSTLTRSDHKRTVDQSYMVAVGTSGSGADSFGNIQKQIRETENQLKNAESQSMQGRDHSLVITLKNKLHTLLAKNERLWQQRSRVDWLKMETVIHGIFTAKPPNGDAEIMFIGSKMRLVCDLTTPGTIFIDTIALLILHRWSKLWCIPQVVTHEMNKLLTCQFTPEEVHAALQQMGPQGPRPRRPTPTVLAPIGRGYH